MYNLLVPLWNLNCTGTKLVCGPPTSPSTPSPRAGLYCLIFLILMLFIFPSFHVPYYASRCVTSASIHQFGTISPSEGYLRPSPILQMILSPAGRPCCCSATSNATSNSTTGKGRPASYMGYSLARAPGSVGRKPCGQGSSPVSVMPDGHRLKVNKAIVF
jgi:hypothetical protein